MLLTNQRQRRAKSQDGSIYKYVESTTTCSDCGEVLGVTNIGWCGHASAGWSTLKPHECKKILNGME